MTIRCEFTPSDERAIVNSWPELAVIEGKYPSQVKAKARRMGLRKDPALIRADQLKRRKQRWDRTQLDLLDVEARSEARRNVINARCALYGKKKVEREAAIGRHFSTFTPDQDELIRAAWPNYRSVNLPHKNSDQIYRRGRIIGLQGVRVS